MGKKRLSSGPAQDSDTFRKIRLHLAAVSTVFPSHPVRPTTILNVLVFLKDYLLHTMKLYRQ
jgi:hypothetical protein